MHKGFFINFESIDGLGKTTQLELLDIYLRAAGYPIHRTKEPGDTTYGTCVSAGIRELLFRNPSTKRMRPGVADLLFLADHIQNAGDVLEAVEAGKVVLCDRYADSQFAYAASEGKQCPSWALQLYREHYGIVPDLTILLRARGPDIMVPFPPPCDRGGRILEDLSWALHRAKTRTGPEAGKQDGKRWNDAEDQRRVQDAYEDNLGGQPRTQMFDVWDHTTIEELHRQILSTVLAALVIHQTKYAKTEKAG
jgi:dTMP kinase